MNRRVKDLSIEGINFHINSDPLLMACDCPLSGSDTKRKREFRYPYSFKICKVSSVEPPPIIICSKFA